MPIDSNSAPQPAATPPHAAQRVVLTITMFATVVLALSLPAPLSGHRTGGVFAAATVASDVHGGGAAAGMPRHESIPLHFGFLEFDWEPGRVPGFGPWPAEQGRR
jgi:hypothetical protein